MNTSLIISVLVCLTLAPGSSNTMSVSNKELTELETLIKAYKDISVNIQHRAVNNPEPVVPKSANGNAQLHEQQVEASKVGLKIMAASHAKACGTVSRIAFEECNKKASTKSEEQQCAETYVDKYSHCYFGETLTAGSGDLMHCTGSCMWNFDNCLVNSDKVEMFICMNGRDICSSNCPWPNDVSTNSKRSSTNCNAVCEGNFDMCFNSATKGTHIWLCNVNRAQCRRQSKCRISGK